MGVMAAAGLLCRVLERLMSGATRQNETWRATARVKQEGRARGAAVGKLVATARHHLSSVGYVVQRCTYPRVPQQCQSGQTGRTGMASGERRGLLVRERTTLLESASSDTDDVGQD